MALPPPDSIGPCKHGVIEGVCLRCTYQKSGLLEVLGYFAYRIKNSPRRFQWYKEWQLRRYIARTNLRYFKYKRQG